MSQSLSHNKKLSFYDTGGVNHLDMCSTYNVRSQNLHRQITADHPGWEICFTARSPQTFKVREKVISIDPKHMLLYNALEKHTEVYDQKSNADFFAVLVSPSFLNSYFSEIGIDANEVVFDQVSFEPNPFILGSVQQLLSLRKIGALDKLSIESILSFLVFEIATKIPNCASRRLRSSVSKGVFPKKVDEIKKTIWSALLSSDLNLDLLSQKCSISKFHMSRIFKVSTGISLGEYIIRLRMTEVKQRLILSSKSVTSIAQDIGYSDVSALNKAFLRHVGITPRQYRAQAKK